MTAKTCADQGQQPGQSDHAERAQSLNPTQELLATKNCWKKEKQSFLRKVTPIGNPIPNSQS